MVIATTKWTSGSGLSFRSCFGQYLCAILTRNGSLTTTLTLLFGFDSLTIPSRRSTISFFSTSLYRKKTVIGLYTVKMWLLFIHTYEIQKPHPRDHFSLHLFVTFSLQSFAFLFKWTEEVVTKTELINMTRAWDKEKSWVPNRNRTHDLPNTGWASYRSPSYENSWRARSFRLFLQNGCPASVDNYNIKGQHTRGGKSLPWRIYTKGLVAGTFTNSSHEAFWGTSRWDLSQKFKLVWIRGTSRRDEIGPYD